MSDGTLLLKLKVGCHTNQLYHVPLLETIVCIKQNKQYLTQISGNFYPLANEVAKGYSNATIRPSVTSL
jgi:uncharacterized protein (DUF2252 family)